MTKKTKRKSPSRAKYDATHRIRSFRLDEATDKRFIEHLNETGCSIADFVKDALGREENMVEERVKKHVSRMVEPSFETRLKCVEDLLHQILRLAVDTRESPPICPYCEDQELMRCEGKQIDSAMSDSELMTWKCPKCGFYIDTFKRFDPKSLRWIDPYTFKYTSRPISSTKRAMRQHG